MTVEFQIEKRYWGSEGQQEGLVTVSLEDAETIGFPDIDLEDALIAREMGFEPEEQGALQLYDEFQRDGLKSLLKWWPEEVFDALLEEGFETISPEDFSAVLEDIVRKNEGYVEETIGVLSNFVEHETGDGLSTFDADHFEDILCEALRTSSQRDRCDEEVLSALVDVRGDTDFFRYDPGTPQESYNDEVYERSHHYERAIYINDKELVSWKRAVEFRIYDPIGFHGEVTDYEEYGGEWKTPDVAATILGFFDLYDEDPEDPEPPDHPEPDETGEAAVLYEKMETQFIRGEGRVQVVEVEEPEERILMPYTTERDAKEAIELSEAVLRRDAEELEWRITLLRRKTDEEYDETLFQKRQLSMFPELEDEWDELLEQWVVAEEE